MARIIFLNSVRLGKINFVIGVENRTSLLSLVKNVQKKSNGMRKVSRRFQNTSRTNTDFNLWLNTVKEFYKNHDRKIKFKNFERN